MTSKSWNEKNSYIRCDSRRDNSIFIQQLRFVFMQALGDFATQGWCRFHQGLAQGWNGVLTLDHNQNMEKHGKTAETWWSTAVRPTIFRTWYLLKLEFFRGSMLQSKNRDKPAEPSKPPHSRGRTILQGLDRLLTFQETDRNDSVDVHRPAIDRPSSCLDHANKAHRLLRCFHPLREILACTE